MKSSQRTLRNRSLRLESLENRELLSVNVAEFETIQKTYADLDIAESIEQYNVIELSAEKLTAADLQNAVDAAAKTEQDDLIVVRTTKENNTLKLEDKPINIDIDSANFGSVALVTLGDTKFEMYSSSNEGLITIANGNVALGAIVLNSTDTFLHIDKVLQVSEKAKLLTSQTACVVERDSRPGNYTIFDEGTAESTEVPDFTYYGEVERFYGLQIDQVMLQIMKENPTNDEYHMLGRPHNMDTDTWYELNQLYRQYRQYYPEEDYPLEEKTSVPQAAGSAPTGLTAVPQVSRNVNLSWNTVSGATSYEVYWLNNGVQQLLTMTTSCAYTTPRVPYGNNTFYVYALSNSGKSTAASVTTTVRPAVPTGLTAVPQTTRNVNLSWNAVSGASYEVYWLRSNGTEQLLTTTTSTAYTTARVTFGSNTFRVYAVASGAKSEAASVTTTVRPAAPTGLTAVPKTTRNVDLSWNTVSGATSYEVYWLNTSGLQQLLTTTTSGTYTTPRVPYGSNTFYVYALAGGAKSEAASVTTTV